ncbi:MAG: hypothetical protein HUU29_12940 [Planctomycetaceae bacterium]|nr:hypothetical protein [Planctomycetaceae bacterium]
MKRLRREANAANAANAGKNASNAGDVMREAKVLLKEVTAAIAARRDAKPSAPDNGYKQFADEAVAAKTSPGNTPAGQALEALIAEEKAAEREVFDLCLFGIDAMRKKFVDDPMALLRTTDMRVIRKARSVAANDGEAESLDKLLLKLLKENNQRAKARLTMVAGALLTNADVQSGILLQRICRERIERFEARVQAEATAQSTGHNGPQTTQGSHAVPSNGQAKAIANAENAMADSERLQKAVAAALASFDELAASQAVNGEPVVGDSCAPVGEQPGDVSAGMAPDALPVNDPALVGATP